MRTLVKILSRQPLWLHYGWADYLLYPLLYHIVRYRRRIVRKNLTHAFPEKSKQEIIALEKRFYHHLADVIVEIIWGYTASADEMAEHMRFLHCDQALDDIRNHGAIMAMLAHICNWEWMADFDCVLSRYGCSQRNIYRQLKNACMDDLMQDIRAQRGGACIEKNQLLRQMIRLRKEGAHILYGMIADQKPSPVNSHCWTTFLHQDTAFLDGSEALSQKFNYPCYYLHIRCVRRGYYEANFIPLDGHGFEDTDYPITRQYAHLLEQNILEQPEQWLWTHNRWKWQKPQS